MKRFVSLLLLVLLLSSLCSCGSYVSSYKALGLVKSQTSHSCEASFHSLEGQLVFNLKKSESGAEGSVSYSVQVDEGEIRLYYDIYGTKEELACVKAGESVDTEGGYIEGGKSVYIIIEATENTKGNVSVELDN